MFENITIWAAFIAGFLSFVSPCVLPIVPAYLSYITGASANSINEEEKFNFKATIPVLFFVAGFSTVFILMGVSASFIGQLFIEYKEYIAKIGGALVVFFGLHFTALFIRPNFEKLMYSIGLIIFALFSFNIFSKDTFFTLAGIWAIVMAFYFLKVHEFLYRQFKVEKSTKASVLSSYFIGLTFGAGWSPCIGPILGSILMLAMNEESIGKGMLLLGVYSLGLGIPFILAGVLWTAFLKMVQKFGNFFKIVEIVGGALLIILGLMLATGNLEAISSALTWEMEKDFLILHKTCKSLCLKFIKHF